MATFSKPITQNYVDFYKDLRKHPLAQASTTFVASALLIIALFGLAIRPTVITISQLNDHIDKLNQLNDKLKSKADTLDSLYPQYLEISPVLDQINLAVPDSSNFLQFEKLLRYYVQNHSLTLSSLSFTGFSLFTDESSIETDKKGSKLSASSEAKATDSQIPAISFALNVKGDYIQVKTFIEDLERSSRIIAIDRVSLQADKKTQGREVNLLLRGRIFYMGAKT